MTYSTARRNPYIIGRPIDELDRFFGRESLFYFIEDNLRQDRKLILLHGQRRIGKSSVLKQIPNLVVQDGFVFVPFDLQDKSQLTLSDILHSLATEIVDHLDLDPDRVTLPTIAELQAAPDIFSIQFLPQVYETLGHKKLVLLLDEFDALGQESLDSVVKHFFPYLRSIITSQNKLSVILCIGRQSEDMPNLLSLFKGAPFQEIGLLDEVSTKRLITKPAQGVLEYEPDALQEILELSAGHPYFTQVICFALFGRARELQNWKVTRADVEGTVDKAIEAAEGGLAWFWDGLSISERVVLSSVAEAQSIALSKAERLPEAPLTLLRTFGVIQTESLVQAANQLVEKGLLDDTGRKVKVELVRRWLVQRHPPQQEIRELEKLDREEGDHLLEVAAKLRQQGKKQNAMAIYEQVLALHPNHFSTLFALAEEYLEVKDFDKAVEIYTRAYQVDPIRYKEGLLRSLLSYGQELITQREFTQAKEHYNRVLEIEPDNASAREKLREIANLEPGALVWKGQGHRDASPSPITSKYRRMRILLGVMAVVAGVTALVSAGVYRLSTPCSAGEKRILGTICIADPSINISRGERTLFPITGNTNRDLGVAAFKRGNYSEATGFFKKAIAANRTDPEVLIYYNNARARQHGSPLTLAVVVPVDNPAALAQKILQGVAQAQNQFNNSRGANRQFLEIVIADDSNDPAKSQQVAQELGKDRSILGVVGSATSDASSTALAEFEKSGLAMISPTSTSTFLTGNVFFRTIPSDAKAGGKLAGYTRKSLGLNKVVIFSNPASVYSKSLSEAFGNNFKQLGGKVVRSIDLSNPNLNPSQEILSSLQEQAEAALLFPSIEYTSAALEIAKANANLLASKPNTSKRRGLKLLGGDTLYTSKTLNTGGTAVQGLVLVVPWLDKSPQSKKFDKVVEQQWGESVSWPTATSFDATQALIKALSPNPSRSTVLQRLRQVNLSPSETSGEALQFTSHGERHSEPILIKVIGSKFELAQKQGSL